MGKIYNIRFLIISFLFLLLVNILFSFPLLATLTAPIIRIGDPSSYYVDPDWTGAKNGTDSEPWTSLTSSAWSTINNALSDYAVTVYFSAREAGTDTEEVSTSAIKLERTDGSSNRLTLDGMSKYNTSDSSPSWSDYGGTLKHVIRNTINASITTLNGKAVLDRNYITVRGFFCNPGPGAQQGIFLKQFSNGIVEDNDIISQVGHSQGPALIITYDNTDPVNTRSQTIIIRNNIIQDNYGEAIYINGCKYVLECSVAQDDILIENNTIINAGSRGGQGDAIDIKNFVTNVIIRGNTIVNAYGEGIVSHSAVVVAQNFITGTVGNAIRFVDYDPYDHKDIAFDGGDIRNNIIIDTKGQFGIRIHSVSGDYDFRNTKISNNIIHNLTAPNSKGIAITGVTKSVDVLNNVVSEVNGIEFYAEKTGALNIHNYNCYYDDDGTSVYKNVSTSKTVSNITDVESNSTGGDPKFYIDEKGRFMFGEGSAVIDAGVVIEDVKVDYYGNDRDIDDIYGWDIGAIEIELAP